MIKNTFRQTSETSPGGAGASAVEDGHLTIANRTWLRPDFTGGNVELPHAVA